MPGDDRRAAVGKRILLIVFAVLMVAGVGAAVWLSLPVNRTASVLTRRRGPDRHLGRFGVRRPRSPTNSAPIRLLL